MSKGWPRGLRHCGINGCRRRHDHAGPCINSASTTVKRKPAKAPTVARTPTPDRVYLALKAARAIIILTDERDRRIEAVRAEFQGRIDEFVAELDALIAEPTG